MMLVRHSLYLPEKTRNFVVLSEARHWYELAEKGMQPQKMEVASPRAPYQVSKGEVSPPLPGVMVYTETEAVFGDTFQWMTNLIVS